MADGTKSLGEKLFDSLVTARAETTTWAALSDQDRTICEKAALAFCARLSHDEATQAVIAELTEQNQRLINEATARARADSAYRARWARDPKMVTVDEIRRHLAGLRPYWSEALAEMQNRVFSAEDKADLLVGLTPRLWLITYLLKSGDRTWSAYDREEAALKEIEAPKGEEVFHKQLVRLYAGCHVHPDRFAITNLDGEDLCHDCANAWVEGEGDHQAYLEQEAGR
ncbi:hypothetical protein OVA11_19240 [Caulobacter sp. SL161]|uniref:hypothetical protein n=1 Tax=Caulobacter sp. SL161 TaxID=2995156 RepID=UPI002274D396|nr:hypothetical protein [Caulobacter sp. SL161]MCY1649114.1 hypothetical protein [Caulobacter sp. SL161]